MTEKCTENLCKQKNHKNNVIDEKHFYLKNSSQLFSYDSPTEVVLALFLRAFSSGERVSNLNDLAKL